MIAHIEIEIFVYFAQATEGVWQSGKSRGPKEGNVVQPHTHSVGRCKEEINDTSLSSK